MFVYINTGQNEYAVEIMESQFERSSQYLELLFEEVSLLTMHRNK